jgi:hypothetical protein
MRRSPMAVKPKALPAHLDPALAGVGLRAVGELAFEIRIDGRPWVERELRAGLDLRGVARGAHRRL